MSPFDPNWEKPAYEDAVWAAALLAVDASLGGLIIRAWSGPQRDAFLKNLTSLFPRETHHQKIPLGITEDRLSGGLDFSATLQAGRPIQTPGILAGGGIFQIAMAERVTPETAARLGCALEETGAVFIALDEGATQEEAVPALFRERLAFAITTLPGATVWPPAPLIEQARESLPGITTDDTAIEQLCHLATAFGVASPRAAIFAYKTARAAAALRNAAAISAEDIELAARLTLIPRATQMPAPDEAPDQASQDAPEPVENPEKTEGELEYQTIEAETGRIPPGLLEALAAALTRRPLQGAKGDGRQTNRRRGRPAGSRPGPLARGARLDILATLRAAAPWQKLRAGPQKLHVRASDFRIKHFKQRAVQTVIFSVDASGSSAMNRLGEAKGAINLLLAQAYARRDEVALITFRGPGAETLLPPTSALARARRSLAALPGGGPTPLAAGIDAAVALAEREKRRGHQPLIVMLTDGGANIGRDAKPGRAQAAADAQAAARTANGFPALVVDTSPRPNTLLPSIAAAMGARYIALPFADARSLAQEVSHAGRI